MITRLTVAGVALVAACGGGASHAPVPPPVQPPAVSLDDAREVHLRNVRQLTFGGENAEAYWSHAGDRLSFQTTRAPYACDQIMSMPATSSAGAEAPATLLSSGKGRTTCAYYSADDQHVIYSSTAHLSDACPPTADMAKGYVWSLYDYAIMRANADGSDVHALADVAGHYDAEATVCRTDGSIVFTSDRDGDLELYRMDADGSNVRRLTHSPGYDGGAFFSNDCSQLVWRASRPTGAALTDYQGLLAEHLVRPTQLELWIGNADGSEARQVTYLGVASFAPFLSPDGGRILFSSNYPDPRGREFDIWSIRPDGSGLERITYGAGFDGFPMFSPDGKRLAFASNRRDLAPGPDGAAPRYRVTGGEVGDNDTNVFVADWIEDATPPADAFASVTAPAERIAAAIGYLADDARAGRATGSPGLVDAQAWVTTQLVAAGVAPGMPDGTYAQPFQVVTGIERGATTSLRIDGVEIAAADFVPLGFAGPGPVKTTVVDAGWGIQAPGKAARDDYRKLKLKGRAALVHRFAPADPTLDQDGNRERTSDLAYKAIVARQAGASALIVVDDGDLTQPEAALPALRGRAGADVGIPVVAVTRAVAAKLRGHKAATIELTIALTPTRAPTANVVGVIRAGTPPPNPLPPLVIGAHLDHLGLGGEGSLDAEPGIHNGADDNASGVAAVLEAARSLVGLGAMTTRDVYVVAFAGEEMGLLGSSHFVANPPTPALATPVAMLNLDMVGRMRGNTLSVLGSESAAEWVQLVPTQCTAAGVVCNLGGSGYGPSDHMAFYVGGAPVLHFFTGGHVQYHRAADDAALINAGGTAQVAAVVAGVARQLATSTTPLTFQKAPAPVSGGDRRRMGASLGTIPTYGADPTAPPGMVISDVVPGGAAAAAGLRAGDRIVKLGDVDVRSVEDLMFVLTSARPGQHVSVIYVRDGARATVDATYGAPRSR